MRSHWKAIALVVLAGTLAYFNCLGNEMFWDDDDFILKNRYIKDWQFFPRFFSENLVAGGYLISNYWRPLLLTVFSIEWHLWKDWVYGWHAVSVAMHIAAGIALYFLLNRLFAHRVLALLTALLFVVHPTHNEAVAYVNSMGDALAALLVFLGLIFYARSGSEKSRPVSHWLNRDYWIAIAFFPLAVMVKETGFVLCGLVPLTEFLLFQSGKTLPERIRRTAAKAWPFIAMAVIYVILRGTVLNFANSFNFFNEENEFTSNIGIRLMTFFKAMAQYAGFLFLPYELRVERELAWAKSVFEWDVLLGGVIVSGMLWSGWHFWKQKPWVSWGIGWFFISIAPTSNVLVPINAVIYEHFLYIPMVGIIFIVISLCLGWSKKRGLDRTFLKIFAVVLVVFCLINLRRNTDWRTAIGFYEQLVTYSPSYRVINNLGMEYADKGIHDKAEYWYNRAIAMDPKNPVAYHNIAGTYRDTGRLDLAIAAFQKAIELDNRFIFSYRSLAVLYYQLGNLPEARRYLQVLVDFDPQDQSARQSLEMLDQIREGLGDVVACA